MKIKGIEFRKFTQDLEFAGNFAYKQLEAILEETLDYSPDSLYTKLRENFAVHYKMDLDKKIVNIVGICLLDPEQSKDEQLEIVEKSISSYSGK